MNTAELHWIRARLSALIVSVISSRRTFCLLVAVAFCWVKASAGAEPPLAAAVPRDVGLCIEIDGLGQALEEFHSGPWFSRIISFPPVAAWATSNRPRLAQLTRQAAGQLGMEPHELVQQVFGREVVIAVWPGEMGRQEPGPGAFLIRAADPALLSRIVERLVSMQRRGDAASVREATYAGRSYYVQQPQRAQPEVQVCLAAVGNVGVVTNREQVMQQVLELLGGDAPVESSLAGLPVYRDGLRRLAPNAVVKAFVQPRRWDTLLAAGLDPSVKDESERRRLLLDTWQAAEYWVASIEVADRIALESYLHLAPERTPADWRELVGHCTGSAQFLEHVPADALVAIAGRVDIARWLQSALARGSDPRPVDLRELRRLIQALFLGWDPVDRIVAGLGPDWGAYLAAAESDSKSLDWVLGVSLVPPDATSPVPSVAEILEGGIRAGLTIVAAIYNAAHGQMLARVETISVDHRPAMAIVGIPEWPPQLPSVGLCLPELLLAGTSMDAVSRAATMRPSGSLAGFLRLRHAHGPRASQPSDVMYVDVQGLRDWILAHSDIATAWIASEKSVPPAVAEREIERLLRLLNVADTAVATVTLAEDDLGVTIAACLEN